MLVPILFIPLFFEVPAIIFACLWFVMQALDGTADLFMPSTGGGVAWWAHIGGFLIGFIIGPLLRKSTRRYRDFYGDEGIYGFDTRGQP